MIICTFVPFWFRFWQCINKKYYTGLNAHLWNAGKYFSKLLPPFILLFALTSNKVADSMFWLWCFFQTLATLYCTVWDYYMDWGLFRCFDQGKYGLREKMKYPVRFYYVAIVVNVVLRFWWVVGVFAYSY